jgi:hypothetical protein
MPIWLRSSLTSIVAGAAARSANLGGELGPRLERLIRLR